VQFAYFPAVPVRDCRRSVAAMRRATRNLKSQPKKPWFGQFVEIQEGDAFAHLFLMLLSMFVAQNCCSTSLNQLIFQSASGEHFGCYRVDACR